VGSGEVRPFEADGRIGHDRTAQPRIECVHGGAAPREEGSHRFLQRLLRLKVAFAITHCISYVAVGGIADRQSIGEVVEIVYAIEKKFRRISLSLSAYMIVTSKPKEGGGRVNRPPPRGEKILVAAAVVRLVERTVSSVDAHDEQDAARADHAAGSAPHGCEDVGRDRRHREEDDQGGEQCLAEITHFFISKVVGGIADRRSISEVVEIVYPTAKKFRGISLALSAYMIVNMQ